MKREQLIYFADAYCGWCYGFGPVLSQFIENHPEIDLEIYMGGLFAGSRVKPMKEYPELSQVNINIKALYDVDFSGMDSWLAEGAYQMNSDQPATVFALFKSQVSDGRKQLAFFEALQEAFYKDGQDLRGVEAYESLLASFGLDLGKEAIETALSNPQGAYEDYRQARAYGVESYPSLVMAHNGFWYNLKGQAISLDDLEENYETIANLPNKSLGCLGC